MSALKQIKKILEESVSLKKGLIKQASCINDIATTMISTLKKEGKIIVFGNGGSAADSQHMVAELVGRFNREKKPLPAIALPADTSILTAISNDYGYEYSFSKQIEAYGRKGDIAFA
ncbi:MAG: SIS domain-containing protein, partial [Candidatus Omnitrophica bacterium]|nr:SIS domain-containing protein [Candidatus Omnitrophota bacterium]